MCGGKTHVVCGREVREDKEIKARGGKRKTFGSVRQFLVRVVQMCAKKPPMGSTYVRPIGGVD